MNVEDLGTLVAAVLAGGGFGGILVKRMSKPVDDATAEKLRADARATAQVAASGEVDVLRGIIAEVRQSEALKTQRIETIEARLEKLEERERHMLTRAAVHEAWDQMAFAALLAMNPAHPPPPPLSMSIEHNHD